MDLNLNKTIMLNKAVMKRKSGNETNHIEPSRTWELTPEPITAIPIIAIAIMPVPALLMTPTHGFPLAIAISSFSFLVGTAMIFIIPALMLCHPSIDVSTAIWPHWRDTIACRFHHQFWIFSTFTHLTETSIYVLHSFIVGRSICTRLRR